MSRCAGWEALEAGTERGLHVGVIDRRSFLRRLLHGRWGQWGKLEQRYGSGVARPLPDPAGGAGA